ncbi:MAG: FISUMP domain-containing protein [Bacteroidales bacterium]
MKHIRLLILIGVLGVVSCNDDITDDTYNELHISADTTHVSSYRENDGAIYLSVSGGKKPYTYTWSTGANVSFIENIYAGTYTVTVSDDRDSSITQSFEITEPDPHEIIISHSATLPTDGTTEDGIIEISVKGGVPPYQYEWSTGDTSTKLTQLPVGTYIITVTDSIEQSVTDTIDLPVPTVTDIDGNSYPIIKLGKQIWMQENLRVSHTPEGEEIEGCYDYDDSSEYSKTYGKLYTWHAIMNGSTEEEARGICPEGWHIPSDDEWKELEIFMGMTQGEANSLNDWRGVGVGTALIKGGSSNFDIQLSGRRSPYGSYLLLDAYEYQWTSTEAGNSAFRRCFDPGRSTVGRWDTFSKDYGFSVRCVKNEN